MRIPKVRKITQYIFTAALLAGSSAMRAQSFTLTTFAGSDRVGDGKQATAVALRLPIAAVQDAAGAMYIVDRRDHRIRKVTPDGVISTIAGTGRAGFSGDGTLAVLSNLDNPTSVRLDGKGNLFIADYQNQRIRKVVLSTGIISTVAGDGRTGFTGDGVPATQTGMRPFDVAVDSDGNLYIADTLNHRVRKVNASDGMISTLVGTTTSGFAGDAGPAAMGQLNFPTGVAVDAQKNVYIADTNNHRVRKITAATGILSTFAGTGTGDITGNGGPAAAAPLFFPTSVDVAANGDVLIAGDIDVRRVAAATGIITLVAGSIAVGFVGDGGPADLAIWGFFSSASAAPNGDVLVADYGNFRIRRIRSGIVNTVAGIGFQFNVEASKAQLSEPAGLGLDTATGAVLFAERSNHVIRGLIGGQMNRQFGDGYATTSLSRLFQPEGVFRTAAGLTYIADTGNNRILRAVGNALATVVAGGLGYGFNVASGVPTSVALAAPKAIAATPDGTIYIADTDNCRIRRIASGLLTTPAGAGRCTYSGDGAVATNAGFVPYDIALDGRGGLLIADAVNNRIRRLDLTTNIITTVAGTGTAGHTGDGGPATAAQIGFPVGVTVDSRGRIFFSEFTTSMVRMIDGGVISTIAGTGDFISSADSGPATAVAFDPGRLAAAADGSIYVSDPFNDRIRKLTPAVPASLQVVQGGGETGNAGDKITLLVRLLDAAGIGIANATLRFQVTSGAATVSSISTVTTNAGTAQVQVTLGATPGPVVVTVSAEGVPSVTASMTVAGVVVPVPQIDDAAVVGAGLSVPPVRGLSAGGIMTAFGKNFGVGAAFRRVGNADLVNGKVPTNFAGLCVDAGGVRAPVFGASDTQVNFQAPAGLSGSVPVKILVGCGTANERSTNAISVAAQAASPEFFYFAATATGRNPVAATDTITGALRASAALFPGSGITAAKPGDFVTVYATGFGDTDPTYAPGDFPAGIGRARGAVRVLLDGVPLPAANVLYAGVTPNSPGLFQLNIQLPADARAGDLTLVIEVGGIQSPAGAFLTVAP